MAFIPEETLREIRDRVSLVELVGETVQLRKAGASWKGLCPFHAEKTPSFTVSEARGVFHCFGCGAGGTAFDFLMRRDGLSFPEAARELARRAGVRIPTAALSPEARRAEEERAALLAVNAAAAAFFRGRLAAPEGAAAREHLAARGVAEATAEAFGLGYAPAAWDALVRHLAAQGYRPELVARAGLAVARPQGGGYYDRFRDRLMIPIADAQGRVVAFGGRALAAGQEPKYLNSAESPVYRKGELLYGLPQAREAIRRADQAVVVEGYFDCIGLHQAGVREAVATCGTALTASQVRLLTRYARRVVTLFDGDEAGLRAAERALPLFLEAELAARIARLPPGEDPDTFVRRRGAGALRELLARAVPLFEAVVDAWARREDTGTAEGKVRVVRAAAPLFERIADRFVRDEYARILAERLGVLGDDAGEELIRRHLPRWRPARAAGPGGPSGGTPAGRPASARWREAAGDCLIRAVLVAPAFAAELVAGPALAELGDPAVSAIVGAVAGLVRQEGAAAVTVGRLAAALDDERARARVSRVAVTLDELGLDEVSARRQGEDAVRRIHERHLSAEHGRLVEAIARARAEGAPLDELAPLLERAGAIMHEMKGLAPYSGP